MKTMFTCKKLSMREMACPKCGRELKHVSKGGITFNGEVDDDIIDGYVCTCGYEEWEDDYRK